MRTTRSSGRGPQPARTAASPLRHLAGAVLLIGTMTGTADPFGRPWAWDSEASRYQNAELVARELPRTRLLTLDGWGHVALGKSSCISAHIARYLGDDALPPGTTCKPDRRPFQ
jgi:TAP-like protein